MTKFFLDEHGCAKNQVDAEIIISRLSDCNFVQTHDATRADIIIINSCGFIESAKKESINAVLAAKKKYPAAKILLTGCLAERYAHVFKESLPEADGIFGNGDLTKIDDVVRALKNGFRPIVTPKQEGICCGNRKTLLSFPGSAYVKITEGCSNHCTFCAIPLIRGEVRSRAASDILAEIQQLVMRGVYEINLIGQDVAAYGTGQNDNVFGTGTFPLPHIDEHGVNCGTDAPSALSLLLRKIDKLAGDFVVRLLYIHPDHFNRDILPVMHGSRHLLPYFDIPFQSGDDALIQAMNRRGSAKEYARLVADIRAVLPKSAIRTTFLTGFPGETEENAENTRAFLKTIQSDWSGCFPYSREENTGAYALKNRVPKKVAVERAQILERMQEQITRERLLARCGKSYDVLIEEVIADEGLAIGRAFFQAPDVDGNVVVRYNMQKDDVRAGNVARVVADSVSGVDIDAHFIATVRIASNNSGLFFRAK